MEGKSGATASVGGVIMVGQDAPGKKNHADIRRRTYKLHTKMPCTV